MLNLNLTRQQQHALMIVLFLFLVGLTVKAWRAAHPALDRTSASESSLP